MPADRLLKLRVDMVDAIHEKAERTSPLKAYRELERQIAIMREAIFLTYDIPGVRYWQPPGTTCPFATAPGQLHGRSDVVELTRVEFLSRYGDPEEL